MVILILSGILVLTLGGCVCVLWAARGGPRWVRGVALTTLVTGELVRRAERAIRKPDSSGGDGS
jgi:hypothetical protein